MLDDMSGVVGFSCLAAHSFETYCCLHASAGLTFIHTRFYFLVTTSETGPEVLSYRQNFGIFLIFSVHGENGLGWPQMGPGGFFPVNPGLANNLGRTDLDFDTFYFFHFLDPKFLDFQVPRFPKSGLGRAGLADAAAAPNCLFSGA